MAFVLNPPKLRNAFTRLFRFHVGMLYTKAQTDADTEAGLII